MRTFFERMQARDWPAAAECLSPSVHIEYSGTGEQFDGPAFLAMNEAYPEGWTIHVVEVLARGSRVAAQVRVEHGEDVFWCAGFYSVRDGVIVHGVEHWVTEQSEAIRGASRLAQRVRHLVPDDVAAPMT